VPRVVAVVVIGEAWRSRGGSDEPAAPLCDSGFELPGIECEGAMESINQTRYCSAPPPPVHSSPTAWSGCRRVSSLTAPLAETPPLPCAPRLPEPPRASFPRAAAALRGPRSGARPSRGATLSAGPAPPSPALGPAVLPSRSARSGAAAAGSAPRQPTMCITAPGVRRATRPPPGAASEELRWEGGAFGDAQVFGVLSRVRHGAIRRAQRRRGPPAFGGGGRWAGRSAAGRWPPVWTVATRASVRRPSERTTTTGSSRQKLWPARLLVKRLKGVGKG
jgi:hypothetical protein